MQRISKVVPSYKPITVYPDGVNVPMDIIPNPTGKGAPKRGEITAFTRQARARMRKALLGLAVPDSVRLGLTLTVPWSNEWIRDNPERCNDEFRECFNRFGVAFRRALSDCGAIFRVELQKRKAPHIHAVCYVAKSRLASTTPAPAAEVVEAAARLLLAKCVEIWCCHAVKDRHGGSLLGFAAHGVKVEPLNMGAMLKYICDHATKAKQAQLGYKGKQWGFIKRANFAPVPATVCQFPDTPEGNKAKAVFKRGVRRLTAYHKAAPCVFGYRTLHNRRKAGVYYTKSIAVLRLYYAACELFHVEQLLKKC